MQRGHVGAAGAIALVVVLAAVSMVGRLPAAAREARLQLEGRGRGAFSSLRRKRQQMVGELTGLRALDKEERRQIHALEEQEHEMRGAWQTSGREGATEQLGARPESRRGRREQLRSSAFPAAFAQDEGALSVCEPWPACCPSGNTDNCFGVISGGVLGVHACSPYPACCGGDTQNCFDESAMPADTRSDHAMSGHDVAQLEAVCEGPQQLKQCLLQTQRCLTPDSEGRAADECTCFSSSLYCSFPQTPLDCSPCPMDCQKHIYDLFKQSQTAVDGTEVHCPLFEKPDSDDVAAFDDGSFRPYAWFSDKELHPPVRDRVVAAEKEPVTTPPIHIKWPHLPRRQTRGHLRQPPRPFYRPQPTWTDYVRPAASQRGYSGYVAAPYGYSYPDMSVVPPHMIDGYAFNKDAAHRYIQDRYLDAAYLDAAHRFS